MRKLFSVLFLLLFIQVSFSQEELKGFKDSVAKLNFKQLHGASLKNMYNDTVKSIIVDSIIKNKIELNEIEKKNKAIAYADLFYRQYSIGNFKECLKYAALVRKSAVEENNYRYHCLSLIITGLTYYDMGAYDLAIEYNFNALEVASKNNLMKLEFAARANMSKFKLAYGDFKSSITIMENCINNLKKEEIKIISNFFPEMYADLTIAHLKNDNLDKAVYYNKLGEKYSKKYNYYLKVQVINKAKIEIEKKNYKTALEILDSSLDIKEKNHDSFNIIADFHLTKGKIYFLKKEFEKAMNEFLKLENLENKKRIHHLSFQEGYSYIAKTYAALGNNDLALEYYKKALQTFTESEKNKINLISEIEQKFDKNTMQVQLKDQKLLNSVFIQKKYVALEKELNTLIKEKKKKNTFIVVLSILFFILIAFVIYKQAKTKKKNRLKFETLLEKTKILEKKIEAPKTPFKKNTHIDIDKNEVTKILRKIERLEKEKFFLKKNCTLVTMAKEVKTNTTYLSKIINSHYQKSFNTYINELRVNYTIKCLKEEKMFRKYSIQAIANEVGFRSKESFNTAFKKQTGILPTYFINELGKTEL
ncbi:MAG: helix-turn-helix domain-containing protein [Polaribacter sp.]